MTRTLRFECSMLQSPVEDMSGGVRWPDVACGDEDDFDSLWGKRHTLEGCVDGDYVLLLPVVRPRSWGTPSQMFQDLVSSSPGCFRGRLQDNPRLCVGK